MFSSNVGNKYILRPRNFVLHIYTSKHFVDRYTPDHYK